jgi:hypothetical protein
MLSHAKTEMDVVKELASDDKASPVDLLVQELATTRNHQQAQKWASN